MYIYADHSIKVSMYRDLGGERDKWFGHRVQVLSNMTFLKTEKLFSQKLSFCFNFDLLCRNELSDKSYFSNLKVVLRES